MLSHGFFPLSARYARLALERGACQKPRELALLIQFLRPYEINTVVEIGTQHGGTFWLWCRLAQPTATLVSIDLPGGAFGGGYSDAQLPLLESYGARDQSLHFLRSDSHLETTRKDLERILGGQSIDFLFIDGDHSYEGVKGDFERYAPLVRPGGLIAFHDILPHAKTTGCEVDRYWDEIRVGLPHRTFTDPGHELGWGPWGGIGILGWPGHDPVSNITSD
jgi:predicted O-methyltransferase YrrM